MSTNVYNIFSYKNIQFLAPTLHYLWLSNWKQNEDMNDPHVVVLHCTKITLTKVATVLITHCRKFKNTRLGWPPIA
jgi:hypothetical protein